MEKGLTKAKGVTSKGHSCFTAPKPVAVVIGAPKTSSIGAKKRNRSTPHSWSVIDKYGFTELPRFKNNLGKEVRTDYVVDHFFFKYPRLSNELEKSDLIACIEKNVLLGEKNLQAHITSKFNELINSDMELEELIQIYTLLTSVNATNHIEKTLIDYNLPPQKEWRASKRNEISRSRAATLIAKRSMEALTAKPSVEKFNINYNLPIMHVSIKPFIPVRLFKATITRNKAIEVVEKLTRLRTIVSSICDAKSKGAYIQNELYSNETLGD
ncbi:MAG: hypothetical protein GY730_04700 [bacterium]|uniref:hypothetical protein n=1 Tax=Pseudoalteromonas sp. bablab_jr010 TaxID=2755063 RepID=UPI0018F2E2BE|nr:hypothetical protein [Pseudoalteromonas sp. bablab_jr010]MCP4049986.1 hypothetical protein [bacterium]